MSKLKENRIIYKEKQMKNINDWVELARTMEWDDQKYFARLKKIFGGENSV